MAFTGVFKLEPLSIASGLVRYRYSNLPLQKSTTKSTHHSQLTYIILCISRIPQFLLQQMEIVGSGTNVDDALEVFDRLPVY